MTNDVMGVTLCWPPIGQVRWRRRAARNGERVLSAGRRVAAATDGRSLKFAACISLNADATAGIETPVNQIDALLAFIEPDLEIVGDGRSKSATASSAPFDIKDTMRRDTAYRRKDSFAGRVVCDQICP